MVREYSRNLRSWDRRICRSSHQDLGVEVDSSSSGDCVILHATSRFTKAQQRTTALEVSDNSAWWISGTSIAERAALPQGQLVGVERDSGIKLGNRLGTC